MYTEILTWTWYIFADEIFMPKDVPGDCHLDENEREIEEFKR